MNSKRKIKKSKTNRKPNNVPPLPQRKQQFEKNILPVPYSLNLNNIETGNFNGRLPPLTVSGSSNISTSDRYFGEISKFLFYDTYKQLKNRGEILLGGFQELEIVIQQRSEENVFNKTLNELEGQGLLSPPISPRINNSDENSNIHSIYNEKDESFSNFLTYHKSNYEKGISTPNDFDKIGSILGTNNHHHDESEAMSVISSISEADYTSSIHSLKLPTFQNPHHDNEFLSTSRSNLDDGLQSHFDSQSLNSVQSIHSMDTYTINSPRAMFLTGCLKRGIPPVTLALLRRKISPKINLAHMNLGNDICIILSKCLGNLPNLQVLNLADNSLTDIGLTPIINSIRLRTDLEELDLSNNKVDLKTSSALQIYCGEPSCQLKTLRLSSADIDDEECAIFVKRLTNNRKLEELDLSKNLIGRDETRNVVQPEFITGAEALAELLQSDICPLKSLNLHWNMIRLESAVALCNSLTKNQGLIKLDLSYNALGRIGADVLGSAMIYNQTLQSLNIAHNGISPEGCFTIFIGLRENKCLQHLDISGNPAGGLGGRALIKLAAYRGDHLTIKAESCDFTARSTDMNHEIKNVIGSYMMDRSIPFERAIAFELLDIVANDYSLFIPSITLSAGSHPGTSTATTTNPTPKSNKPSSPNTRSTKSLPSINTPSPSITVIRLDEIILKDDLSRDAMEEISDLETLIELQRLDSGRVIHLLKSYDTKGYNQFPSKMLKNILQDLKLSCSSTLLEDVRFAADPYSKGYIHINEFIAQIRKRSTFANLRLKQVSVRKLLALSTSPDSRFIPSNTGKLSINISHKLDLSVHRNPLSMAKCKQIIRAAKETSNILALISFALEQYTINLEEAKLFYEMYVTRSEDPVNAMARIIPRMPNPDEAMIFMKGYVGHDVMRLRRLKQKLGHTFNPFVGLYSGYYSLDFTVENDRLCMERLIEQNLRNVKYRQECGKGDTSQHGNWTYFRNEVLRGVKRDPRSSSNVNGGTDNEEAVQISPTHFQPMPKHGKIEFDFVNVERPNPKLNEAIEDDALIDIILVSRLLRDDYQKDRAVQRLHELSIANRKSFLSNGQPLWKCEYERSLSICESMIQMYNGLKQRKKSLIKSSNREHIRVRHNAIPSYDSTSTDSGTNPSSPISKTRIQLTNESVSPTKLEMKRSHRNLHESMGSQSVNEDLQLLETFEMDNDSSSNKQHLNQIVSGIVHGVHPSTSNHPKAGPEVIAPPSFQIRYKSRVNVEINLQSNKGWNRRMFEVMLESKVTNEFKSAALLEYFSTELMNQWLYCKHLSLICELFRMGLAHKSNIGSYRVELIITLYDRLIDLHNFELVLMSLCAEEQAALYVRLGVLNMFNPCKPEGGWVLSLDRWEERQLAKMLIHLNVVEGSSTWSTKSYIVDMDHESLPNWELNKKWFNEEGLPTVGYLRVEITSDILKINQEFRKMLKSLVLIEQRDVLYEIKNGHQLMEIREPTMKVGRMLLKDHPIDPLYVPIQPWLKLQSQSKLLKKMNGINDGNENNQMEMIYKVDHVDKQLKSTELEWNYFNEKYLEEKWDV